MKIITPIIAASLLLASTAHAETARSQRVTILVQMAKACAEDVTPLFMDKRIYKWQTLASLKDNVRTACGAILTSTNGLTQKQSDAIMGVIVDDEVIASRTPAR